MTHSILCVCSYGVGNAWLFSVPCPAAAATSGCKTSLAGFVTALVVGGVLLVLTPLFARLPLNVMGAIVISGVSGLFEYEQAVHLFRVRACVGRAGRSNATCARAGTHACMQSSQIAHHRVSGAASRTSRTLLHLAPHTRAW